MSWSSPFSASVSLPSSVCSSSWATWGRSACVFQSAAMPPTAPTVPPMTWCLSTILCWNSTPRFCQTPRRRRSTGRSTSTMTVSGVRQQARVGVNQGQVGTLSQTLAASHAQWVGGEGGWVGGGKALELLLWWGVTGMAGSKGCALEQWLVGERGKCCR